MRALPVDHEHVRPSVLRARMIKPLRAIAERHVDQLGDEPAVLGRSHARRDAIGKRHHRACLDGLPWIVSALGFAFLPIVYLAQPALEVLHDHSSPRFAT